MKRLRGMFPRRTKVNGRLSSRARWSAGGTIQDRPLDDPRLLADEV